MNAEGVQSQGLCTEKKRDCSSKCVYFGGSCRDKISSLNPCMSASSPDPASQVSVEVMIHCEGLCHCTVHVAGTVVAQGGQDTVLE